MGVDDRHTRAFLKAEDDYWEGIAAQKAAELEEDLNRICAAFQKACAMNFVGNGPAMIQICHTFSNFAHLAGFADLSVAQSDAADEIEI